LAKIHKTIYFFFTGMCIFHKSLIKKTQKMPKAILDLAKQRLKEFKNG